MDGRNMSFGGDGIDWGDPAFSTAEFQDSMIAESPYGNSNAAFTDFTNLADYSDSPGNWGLRTPSKSGPDGGASNTAQQPSHGLPNVNTMPGELSSQDSSSDSSSRRKRKSISESPMPDAATVDSKMQTTTPPGQQEFAAYNRGLPNLSVESTMPDQAEAMFDFNSAASSPNLPRDFNQQLSLDANMAIRKSPATRPFVQDSPATINPGSMFALGSRDQSPATNNVMFTTASPNAIFSTPSSDSNDLTMNQNWTAGLQQNPAWPSDFSSQFASPAALGFTPSPVTNGATPSMGGRAVVVRAGRSPLHIAPISTKSRVETQINVIMTLERPPPGVETLHLPLHTIAKSKLLAKEDYEKATSLELHTMLVCTSAMNNASMKEKALKKAAQQDNAEIQRRAELHREGDEDKPDGKVLDDDDKPSNGGEVKICNNCIQRERKRAGRKKLKKEEEQQHWERYETERVVVFNSNEYLPFKPAEQMPQPQREGGMVGEEVYNPPDGAISVQAQMRIACYCRHQSEKEGFQVIFTIKDQQKNVVAQQISDSILITDDHKTHPPQLTTVSSELLMGHPQLGQNGMPTSYSMVDLHSHASGFTTSRSAGNLQALGQYAQQVYNPQSHVHQLPHNGYPSQTTSATITPTSLSRPGSPSSAGQAGPNKKRKSSSFHRKIPSGLAMTPRVDTNQASAANSLSGVPMSANFSPTGAAFAQNDPSFMTIPNNGGAAGFYGSNPPTPANEHAGFAFNAAHQLDIGRAQNAAYFSHPSSAVPSRSNSPILQHGHNRNISGFTPRQPLQTTTNSIGRANQFYGGQAAPGADDSDIPSPMITKVTPAQGPVAGGTEVSIFGYNFTHNMQIMFGDSVAPTTFYGEQSILAISPPGRRGPVRVKIVSNQRLQYPATQNNHTVFTYQDTNVEVMEMALKAISQQQLGDPSRWMQYANDVANQFMQTSITPAGIQTQNYPGGNMLAAGFGGGRLAVRMRESNCSNASWDGGSAASYEYDADESECAITVPSSRRESAYEIPSAPHEDLSPSDETPASAALLAWRDALAMQIQHFQQTVQDSVSSFQLPALPPLPDYQDYAMVRRLSSLVPSRSHEAADSHTHLPRACTSSRLWDLFSSAAPASPTQPPAYSELFPDSTSSLPPKQDNEAAVTRAVVDAIADHKSAVAFDHEAPSTSASSSSCDVDATTITTSEERSCARNNTGTLTAIALSWFSVSPSPRPNPSDWFPRLTPVIDTPFAAAAPHLLNNHHTYPSTLPFIILAVERPAAAWVRQSAFVFWRLGALRWRS